MLKSLYIPLEDTVFFYTFYNFFVVAVEIKSLLRIKDKLDSSEIGMINELI